MSGLLLDHKDIIGIEVQICRPIRLTHKRRKFTPNFLTEQIEPTTTIRSQLSLLLVHRRPPNERARYVVGHYHCVWAAKLLISIQALGALPQ